MSTTDYYEKIKYCNILSKGIIENTGMSVIAVILFFCRRISLWI